MKIVILVSLCLFLTSCASTRNMQSSSMKSQAAAHTSYYENYANQPLSKITLPDGTVIETAHPVRPAPPIITMPRNEWADTAISILNSTPLSIVAGGWAGKQLLKYSNGPVNNNGDGTVNLNSGNATRLENNDLSAHDGITYDKSYKPSEVINDDHSVNSSTEIIPLE